MTTEGNEVVVLQEGHGLSTEAIKAMIQQLSVTEEGEPLKDHMDKLKLALKHNPVACAMLLPEDIGQMVSVLQRITGLSLEEQATPEKRKKKKDGGIDFTDPEALKKMEDDLF